MDFLYMFVMASTVVDRINDLSPLASYFHNHILYGGFEKNDALKGRIKPIRMTKVMS